MVLRRGERRQGRWTGGKKIGNMKNCTGIIRRIGGKYRRWEPRVNGKKMEGEEKIIVWVMDRARREEWGNSKIHKGLREKGKTGDGPYPNHLGRDWDERRMGERRESDRQWGGGERRVGLNGPDGNSKGNKYKEREGTYLNPERVCAL